MQNMIKLKQLRETFVLKIILQKELQRHLLDPSTRPAIEENTNIIHLQMIRFNLLASVT